MNAIRPSKLTAVFTWSVLLLTSLLPVVISQEIFHRQVTADEQVFFSGGVVLLALLAALLWKTLRPVLPFLALLLVLVGADWLVYARIAKLGPFPGWLGDASFNIYMLAEQGLNLMITLMVMAALLLMGIAPKRFFLLPGSLNAPAERVRWLGIDQGTRWNLLGLLLALFLSLGTLAFLVLAGSLPLERLRYLPAFIPAILLAAALNAFSEEMTYKASFLTVLEGPLGRQAVVMVAVYFGIWHYYGVPYGIVGIVLATFLGWLLAKSMLETRGSFWAWFIHFWQDVWIFSFLALGSIVPGGG